jgi:hypothetical protein
VDRDWPWHPLTGQGPRGAWEERERMDDEARGPAGAKCKEELKDDDRVGHPIGAVTGQKVR